MENVETQPKVEASAKKGNKVAAILIMLAAGGMVGAVAGHLISSKDFTLVSGYNLPKLGMVLLLPFGLFFSIFLAIFLHELGHVIGGKLAGMRFYLLVVGPLKITNSDDGLQFAFNKNMAIAGGLALCLPKPEADKYRSMLSMIAGGPVASVVVGLLLIPILFLPNFRDWVATGLGNAPAVAVLQVLIITGITSFTIGLTTLIPSQAGGFYSDGARLLQMLKRDKEAAVSNTFISIYALSVSGVRPRDLNREELVELVNTEAPALFKASIALYVYYHFIDSGELEEAKRYLDLSLASAANVAPAVQRTYEWEAAFYYAFYEGNGDKAAELVAKGSSQLSEPHTLLRVQAAVALAQGKHAEALEKCKKALATVGRSLDKGAAAYEKDVLREIQKRAEMKVLED